jgi:AbrB family looped-hinge helix DNA binding protein
LGILDFAVLLLSIDHIIVLHNSDGSMTRTTLSPKFQIVIPKDVRKALKLRPGAQFNVIEHEGRIELLPVRSPKQMRGFLRGIDTSVPREKDRV